MLESKGSIPTALQTIRGAITEGLRPFSSDIFEDDPVAWAETNLKIELRQYQKRILRKIAKEPRLAARSLHGTGKTTTEAILILWYADVSERLGVDWKIITTASAWRHLSIYLWPEVHKWASRLPSEHWIRKGLKLRQLSGRFGQASAVASNKPDKIEGAHASRLLYVFSEAKAIPVETWDAAEGAFSTGDCKAIALSTPGKSSGRFFDFFAKRDAFSNWATDRIALEEALAEGAVSRQWVEDCRRAWGEDSPVFKNRVLGEFSSDSGQVVIPLAWIEAGVARWIAWKAAGKPGALRSIGVDVGTEAAKDLSVICGYRGEALSFRSYLGLGVLAVADRAEEYVEEEGGAFGIPMNVDANGAGAGTMEALRRKGRKVVPFIAGAHTDRKDASGFLGFFDCRSAALWGVRERLDPARGATLAIEPIDELIEDLSTPTYWETSRGLLRVEDKDSQRLELGRSPDHGDAASMALWETASTGSFRDIVGGSPRISGSRRLRPLDRDRR